MTDQQLDEFGEELRREVRQEQHDRRARTG
jgi:hypothetical protein